MWSVEGPVTNARHFWPTPILLEQTCWMPPNIVRETVITFRPMPRNFFHGGDRVMTDYSSATVAFFINP
jgi:hypothetical protein